MVPALKESFTSRKERNGLAVLHVTFLVYNSGIREVTTAAAIKLFKMLNVKVTSKVSTTNKFDNRHMQCVEDCLVHECD